MWGKKKMSNNFICSYAESMRSTCCVEEASPLKFDLNVEDSYVLPILLG